MPESTPEMGRTWVRSQAAADLEPGLTADAALTTSAPLAALEPPGQGDHAPRLPHTPPIVDDVNFVTVGEHEYVPQGMDAPTHGSRLLAQVRRSWAVSRSRSTG